MTLDDRIRRGLEDSPEADDLDLDRELERIVGSEPRRNRRPPARRILVAVALVVVLVAFVLVMQTRSGGERRPAAVSVPDDQLVAVSPAAKVASVDVARAAISSPDVGTLVRDNTEFAFDLYRRLAARDRDNLFFSPQSISTVLAMTYAGARGETAAQMAGALHFGLAPSKVHEAFNALDQQLLAPRTAPTPAFGSPAGVEGEPLALEIDNSLWAQRDRPFIKAFLETVATAYGAPVHLVEYRDDPEQARRAINRYVAEHTKNRIPELLSTGDLDAYTRLVLLNTVYFKASWQTPFEPEPSTPFHLLDGTTGQAEMMTTETRVPAVHTDEYDAVRIPYLGAASMRIVVPAPGRFDDVETRLGADLLQSIRTAETSQPDPVGRLTMPKFAFSTRASLGSDLQELGMRDAFDPDAADFTGLSPVRDLFIKTVVHKATVAVDERGTEATAATGAIVNLFSLGPVLRDLTVDRPFFVVIEDDATHAVLFAGRVTDPSRH